MVADKRNPGDANEASPLLGHHLVNEDYGSSAPASSSTTAIGDEETLGSSTPTENGGDEVTRDGLPDMAKKLPVLLSAMGIGMFLCALDQLLVVATYGKISSDLQALNRTSWVSTA